MSFPQDIELLAIQKMINSSEAMFDRRRRILREARRIISENGLDQMNMRELARRADVSTKTVYNAFGSKEMVIALAIYTYFEQFVTHTEFDEDVQTFPGALARQTTSTLRDIDIPNYMRAVIALYFSPTVHPTIHAVLIDLATRSWLGWLKGVEDRRELHPGVVVRELLVDLSNVQYGRIHEWSAGGIDDDVFMRRSLSSILMLLMGATVGAAHEEVRQAFTAAQSDARYREEIFGAARQRIDAALSALDSKSKAKRSRLTAKVLL
ncbi:TetR/AcrR family transcriptional regulator [Novosphingobium resinovorum]|uniref:HTH tetR-type domain-containing protein n=1 Tax=Novosphingobium resinovorum TaxID=158500 RepID=A0A1D8AEN2_9SPHN|nr:TetR/AcrR family transcriptional regulator [Novosphingobium resinovorum]AOR80563.1 hypothetical protein BES08_27350 [Novosphingobium resinovorum]